MDGGGVCWCCDHGRASFVGETRLVGAGLTVRAGWVLWKGDCGEGREFAHGWGCWGWFFWCGVEKGLVAVQVDYLNANKNYAR